MKTVLALGLTVTLLATVGAGRPAPSAGDGGTHAARVAAGNRPNGCVADWLVSYGGASTYEMMHTDPEDIPLSDLRLSRSYDDPTDLSHGYLDFARAGRMSSVQVPSAGAITSGAMFDPVRA